jgi:hypothetical protein
MGFWKDVKDLRAALKEKVAAGRGSRSLVEAVRGDDPAPAAQEEVGVVVPDRMSAAQYRELVEKGVLPGPKR